MSRCPAATGRIGRAFHTATYVTGSLPVTGSARPCFTSRRRCLGREFGPEGYGEYLEHKMIHLPAGWEA
ncbi:hypothetical protein GCM10010121_022870 [Streptomyces brasiliensis]|uniref:Uncharacterized protein n=2 Tax=Streptomyces brasiliensis TaxID=1954 RepID=A0A917KFA5_9ACTN|nr:hypothetical protein GCM10010121_022870 [Streptomyces brasiliensis]